MKIEYTDNRISNWGGLILLKEMLDKIGIKEKLKEMWLPPRGSNRSLEPIEILISFWIMVWIGASRFIHVEKVRNDKVLQEIFGIKRVPSQSTMSRFFGKYNWHRNTELYTEIQKWFFQELKVDNVTLDFDSTVMTRYGEQEGVKVGYNPSKPGRGSHHPLMAFMAETRMVVNAWLRVGNSVALSGIEKFIEETTRILAGKKIGLIRADSGFFSNKVLEYLELKEMKYIIAVKFYKSVRKSIFESKGWITLKDGIQIKELTSNIFSWKEQRRLIVVRKDTGKIPKATGKLLLFENMKQEPIYRYSSYVTNLDLPAEQIWHIYKDRGDAENRIKELKYDFALDGFCMKKFWATEIAFMNATIAYNLMSLFRQVVLQKNPNARLETLRFKCFAIGCKIVNHSREKILKLSLIPEKRKWLDGLFSKIADTSPPFSFPNA